MFKIKSLAVSEEGAIIDIDEAKSMVVGYFAHFKNIDSDGDITVKGAFKKTIAESKRIKHLYQHNPFMPLSGIRNGGLTLSEDNKGLRFESKISDTSWGRDTIKLYADGVVDEHSYGFEVLDSTESKTDFVEYYGLKKPVRIIKEVRLWEGSTVTWGSNELALGYLSKDMLNAKHLVITKAFRDGKYENEEIFEAFELYLKQLHTMTTQPIITGPESLKTLDNFITTLNIDNYLKN